MYDYKGFYHYLGTDKKDEYAILENTLENNMSLVINSNTIVGLKSIRIKTVLFPS